MTSPETLEVKPINDMAAAITQAITQASDELPNERRGRIMRELKYWRMCTRRRCPVHADRKGWITIGPTRRSDPGEHNRYIEDKHMEEMPDSYGTEVVGLENSMSGNATRFKNILNAGGLQAFPPEQIHVYGWHRLAVVREALTPDQRQVIDVMEEGVQPCRHGCPNVILRTPEDVHRHIVAKHPETQGPEAVGRRMESAIEKMASVMTATNGGGTMDAKGLVELVTASILQLEAARQQAQEKRGGRRASTEEQPQPEQPQSEQPGPTAG